MSIFKTFALLSIVAFIVVQPARAEEECFETPVKTDVSPLAFVEGESLLGVWSQKDVATHFARKFGACLRPYGLKIDYSDTARRPVLVVTVTKGFSVWERKRPYQVPTYLLKADTEE